MPDSPILTPRQRQLFDALLTTFLSQGFADFTIDSATKQLHCSKSTLYSLGRTRSEIIRRVLVTFFKEVTRRTDAQLIGAPNATQALERYFQAMSQALEPASPAFMHDLTSIPLAREVYATNTAAATAKVNLLISQGVESGEFRTVSPGFVATVIAAAMQEIQAGKTSDHLHAAEAYRELGNLVIHGLKG